MTNETAREIDRLTAYVIAKAYATWAHGKPINQTLDNAFVNLADIAKALQLED